MHVCVLLVRGLPLNQVLGRERERVPFMIGLEKRRKRRGGNVSVPPWPSPVYAFTPAERLFVTESRKFTAWWR